MEKIPPESSWNLPPTGAQVRQITLLCRHLGIKEYLENSSSNRLEARDLIYQLRAQRKANRRKKKWVTTSKSLKTKARLSK